MNQEQQLVDASWHAQRQAAGEAFRRGSLEQRRQMLVELIRKAEADAEFSDDEQDRVVTCRQLLEDFDRAHPRR